MSNNRWILGAVGSVVLIGCFAFWLHSGGEPPAAVDLIDEFPTAEKRSTLPRIEAFSVTDVTIDGQTRRAIFTRPTSRIIWKVDVPANAELRTALALRQEAWTLEGDGVLFRIGVSDGRTYDELLKQHVHPYAVSGDRRWIPVVVDLSPYGGRRVDIIFNTNTSLPGRGDDGRSDLAVWGEPQIYVRRQPLVGHARNLL